MTDIKIKIDGDASGAKTALGDAGGYVAKFREELNKGAEKMFSMDEIARKATDAILDFAKESVKAVYEFGVESVHAYMESEKAVRQLQRAAGENTDAFREQAAAFRDQLGVSDELVMKVQKMLLTFGEAPDAVRATTKAILDYAAYSGTDAVSATHALLSATQSGKTAFKELGLEYNKTGIASQDLMNITGALAKKVGGTAAGEADTLEGSLRKAKEQTDEFKEGLGKLMSEFITKTGVVTTFIGVINDLTEALTGDKAHKQYEFQEKVNHLRAESIGIQLDLSKAEEHLKFLQTQDNAETNNLIADQIRIVKDLRESAHFADVAMEHLLTGKQNLSTTGADRFTNKGSVDPGKDGKDTALKKEQERELEDYKAHALSLQELERKEDAAQAAFDQEQNEKKFGTYDDALEKGKEYWEKELKLQQEGEKKELEEADKAGKKAIEAHEKLQRKFDEANKKFKEQMEKMGGDIAFAFAKAMAAALEQVINGDEVDVLGVAADLAFGVAAIVGSTLADIYGGPAAGRAVGTVIGLGGEVAHAARSKAWKEEKASRGKRHDGGWLDRAHSGRWMEDGLSSDEQLIVAQSDERMLSRSEVARMGGKQGVDAAARGGGKAGLTIVVPSMDSTNVREFFEDRGGRGFVNAIRTGRGSLSPLFGGG